MALSRVTSADSILSVGASLGMDYCGDGFHKLHYYHGILNVLSATKQMFNLWDGDSGAKENLDIEPELQQPLDTTPKDLNVTKQMFNLWDDDSGTKENLDIEPELQQPLDTTPTDAGTELADECDPWMVDDWVSLGSGPTSPCNTPKIFEKMPSKQHEVANLIMFEFQAVLKAQMQQAKHEFGLWVSEDFASIQQDLKGFKQKVNSEMRELRAQLDEQGQEIRKLRMDKLQTIGEVDEDWKMESLVVQNSLPACLNEEEQEIRDLLETHSASRDASKRWEEEDSDFRSRQVSRVSDIGTLESLQVSKSEALEDYYNVGPCVGNGSTCTVWRCEHRESGEVRAVKRISRSDMPSTFIKSEIRMLDSLRNDSIIQCHQVFLRGENVDVVLDMFHGGDLIDSLHLHRKTFGCLEDATLAHVTAQMLNAVAYMHSLDIAHRDIKGDNFLCNCVFLNDPNCHIVLADLGTAIPNREGEWLDEELGTISFWAPEVWNNAYDRRADVWALGITIVVLLTEELPSIIAKRVGATSNSLSQNPHLRRTLCEDSATLECAKFVEACLTPDLHQRPRASELSDHCWLTIPDSGRPSVHKQSTFMSSRSLLGGCITGIRLCLDEMLSYLAIDGDSKASAATNLTRGTHFSMQVPKK